MEIKGKIPKTLVEACKKTGFFTLLENEGEDAEAVNNYWLYLKDGLVDGNSGGKALHGFTIKGCISRFKFVITEKEYKKKVMRQLIQGSS
jgi:hypothetical protein